MEYRYSQDERWEVDEPEAARLSEEELAEEARLRDSFEKAKEKRLKSFPNSPILTSPKFVPIKKRKTKTIESATGILEGLGDFDEFKSEAIRDKADRALRQYGTLDDKAAVWFTVLKQMKTYGRSDEEAFRNLRIRLLKRVFPRIKILIDYWIKVGQELNLPEELAEERAEDRALRVFDPEYELLPQKQNVKRIFEETVFRILKEDKGAEPAFITARSMTLALDAREAVMKFFDEWEPREKSTEWERDLKNMGSLAVGIIGRGTPLAVPMLLTLYVELRKRGNAAEKIWTAIDNEKTFEKIRAILEKVIGIFSRAGWIEETFLKPPGELKPAEGEEGPGDTQVRQFIRCVLGSGYSEEANEVGYASRSSERA